MGRAESKVNLLGGLRGRLRGSRSPVHQRLLLLLSGLVRMLSCCLLRWHGLALHGLASRMRSCACREQCLCACDSQRREASAAKVQRLPTMTSLP